MKKKLSATFFVAMLMVWLSSSTFAANRVNEISIDVTLYPDGSADVVQVWDGSFEEGTECYFPVTDLGETTLDALTVSDANGTYTTLDRWDVDMSFEEKAGKCGLAAVDGGYEVCWGITEYGDNRYLVQYRLGNLVGGYDDSDGFLFQFVPKNMGTLPTDVTVRIQMQDGTLLNAEHAGVWGFGFEGQVGFHSDGTVWAYTESPLSSGDQSVIIMLELQKEILDPARKVPGSFAAVKTRAFEGSDYGDDNSGDDASWALVICLLVATPIVMGLLLWFTSKERRAMKKLYRQVDYFREAPLHGDLEASHAMAQQFYQSGGDGSVIAALLLKMVAQGCLEPLTERDVGFMGRESEAVSLRLVKPPVFPGVTAAKLYQLLASAAGRDGILQERELEHHCKEHYRDMLAVARNARHDGKKTLEDIRCYRPGAKKEGLADLTEQGMTQLMHLMGFKKYLLDFSLIGERGVSEAIIWQDCLSFAALFGIADQVMAQLNKLYPSTSAAREQAQTAHYVAYRYHHVTYEAAKAVESQNQRSDGGGGSSSVGGGGGFSGGGSGGGTR